MHIHSKCNMSNLFQSQYQMSMTANRNATEHPIMLCVKMESESEDAIIYSVTTWTSAFSY